MNFAEQSTFLLIILINNNLYYYRPLVQYYWHYNALCSTNYVIMQYPLFLFALTYLASFMFAF